MHLRLYQLAEVYRKWPKAEATPAARAWAQGVHSPPFLLESPRAHSPRGMFPTSCHREKSRGGICSGRFLTSSRSRHASIQPSGNHVTRGRIQKSPERSSISSKLRAVMDRDKVDYKYPISRINLHLNRAIIARERIDQIDSWMKTT